jgi:hypothetical protein
LARLAQAHRDELRRIGPFMKQFFSELRVERDSSGDGATGHE